MSWDGRFLKMLRESRGLSQQALCAAAGHVALKTLSTIENSRGDGQLPQMRTLARLAEALEAPTWALVAGRDGYLAWRWWTERVPPPDRTAFERELWGREGGLGSAEPGGFFRLLPGESPVSALARRLDELLGVALTPEARTARLGAFLDGLSGPTVDAAITRADLRNAAREKKGAAASGAAKAKRRGKKGGRPAGAKRKKG